jgi:hypothetical protein
MSSSKCLESRNKTMIVCSAARLKSRIPSPACCCCENQHQAHACSSINNNYDCLVWSARICTNDRRMRHLASLGTSEQHNFSKFSTSGLNSRWYRELTYVRSMRATYVHTVLYCTHTSMDAFNRDGRPRSNF